MNLTINEKKILTAFGSPDLLGTITCLQLIADLTPVSETKKALNTLALKLTTIKPEEDYQDFFYILKLYDEEYLMKATQFRQMQPIILEDDDGETDEG